MGTTTQNIMFYLLLLLFHQTFRDGLNEIIIIIKTEKKGLFWYKVMSWSFQVLFNLATQYCDNEMYTEALNTYQVMTRNKVFSKARRLKVNMGNIYYKLQQYNKAVKMYRMAMDQVPNTQKDFRLVGQTFSIISFSSIFIWRVVVLFPFPLFIYIYFSVYQIDLFQNKNNAQHRYAFFKNGRNNRSYK